MSERKELSEDEIKTIVEAYRAPYEEGQIDLLKELIAASEAGELESWKRHLKTRLAQAETAKVARQVA